MNKLIFKVVGVAAVAALFCVGCSEKPGGGDDDPCANGATEACCADNPSYEGCEIAPPDTTGGGADTTGGDELDGRLVLDDGYGWVGVYQSMTMAYIFKADGRFVSGMKMMGKWQFGGGDEEYPDAARWHTNGNKLYLVTGASVECIFTNDENSCVYTEFDTTVFTYSVSGNNLALSGGGMSLTYSKTYLTDDEEVEVDPALANTAWKDEATGNVWTFIYKEGNNAAILVDGNDELLNLYSFTTSDGNLYLTPLFGEEVIYAYSISGDELTLNGVKYTKTDFPEDDDDDWGSFKSRADKAFGEELGKGGLTKSVQFGSLFKAKK